MPSLPLLFTMGDAAGIGPECIARLFAAGEGAGTVVVGDVSVMRRAAALTSASLDVKEVDEAALRQRWLTAPEAGDSPVLPVLQPPRLPPGLETVPWGLVDARCGEAAAACIRTAVGLVQRGRAQAIVTAPLHKEALAAAGVDFPGHTEMLQALAAQGPGGGSGARAGSPPPVRMMLANEELRVVLVTIHQSLRHAIEAVTYDAVLETLRVAHAALPRWGVKAPRIAVAGLNPHAGEGGLFGDEELRIIGPAVQAAREEGIDARGPFAPDTVFMRARHAPGHPGEFDAVVAMTHDHGLIPVKYLGVEQGVNITLGLPFVRTSPDHGTAFDIAGRGVADPSSLRAALRAARRAVLSGG